MKIIHNHWLQGAAAVSVLALAGCGSAAAVTPKPTVTVTAPTKAPAAPAKSAPAKAPAKAPPTTAAPAQAAGGPTIIINNNTAPPAPSSTVYVPIPASAPSYVTNDQAVVQQYYNYLNSQDFQDAWNMGGANIGGTDYNSWVNGYTSTTQPGGISLSTWDYYPNSNVVQVTISAVQLDGSTRTYAGSYAVVNGSLVSADIVQTSGSSGSSQAAPAPAAAAPASDLTGCGGGLYAGPSTSCPFAQAVENQYSGDGGPDTETVWSPVTSQYYTMTYTAEGNWIVATGGNSALVQFTG